MFYFVDGNRGIKFADIGTFLVSSHLITKAIKSELIPTLLKAMGDELKKMFPGDAGSIKVQGKVICKSWFYEDLDGGTRRDFVILDSSLRLFCLFCFFFDHKKHKNALVNEGFVIYQSNAQSILQALKSHHQVSYHRKSIKQYEDLISSDEHQEEDQIPYKHILKRILESLMFITTSGEYTDVDLYFLCCN